MTRGDELTEVQVSPLELFFDLVFVFTLTQLTPLLEHHFTWESLAQVTVLLSVLWYMYGGFAYLTNAVAPLRMVDKFFVLFGMAGFYVVALAIPHAFGDTGLVFALAYLLVVLIHAGLYLTTAHEDSRRGIRKIAPVNLAGVACLIGGSLTTGWVHWALWVAAPLIMWGNGLWNLKNIYVTRPHHFVERHALVLLVAFGESVVAVGVAADPDHVDLPLILTAVLALTVVTALWWAHFVADHLVTERFAASGEQRGRVAIFAFGHTYVPLLGGVIIFAAGAAEAVAHPTAHLHWPPALAIAGGVALYLAGNVLFRTIIGLRSRIARAAGAILVLPTVFAGVHVSALLQLALLAAVLVLAMAVDFRTVRQGT